MLRRLFNVVTLLSLLLGAAVCVLWVRSYRAGGDFLNFVDHETDGRERYRAGQTTLQSSQGGLALIILRERRDPGDVTYEQVPWSHPGAESRYAGDAYPFATGRWGFRFGHKRFSVSQWDPVGPHLLTVLTVPHAAVAGVMAIFPLLWCLLRLVRPVNCLCVQCGYDLSATAGDACPNCGTPITRSGPKTIDGNRESDGRSRA